MKPGDAAPKTVTIARRADGWRGRGQEPGWTCKPGEYGYCDDNHPDTDSDDRSY
jgi:hypothetical protein